MTHLSTNFTLKELIHSNTAKQKGLKNEPNENQIENLKLLCEYVLEPIREKIGCPLFISSGFRSEKVNVLVGGSKTSQHILGQAADIQIFDKTKTNVDLFNTIVEMIKLGEIQIGQCIAEKVGGEIFWVHISTPTDRLRNQILIADIHNEYNKHKGKFEKKTNYTRIL